MRGGGARLELRLGLLCVYGGGRVRVRFMVRFGVSASGELVSLCYG